MKARSPSGEAVLLTFEFSDDKEGSLPLHGITVERYLAVDSNCHEFVALGVLELHDLTTAPRQLSPPAWLFGVLFNGLVFVTLNPKRSGFQPLAARAADRRRVAFDGHRALRHQLRSDGP